MPALRVAVEAEVASDFCSGTGRPTGATAFKRRVLRRAGWQDASVPFAEWQKLRSAQAKRALIGRKLCEAGVEAAELEAAAAAAALTVPSTADGAARDVEFHNVKLDDDGALKKQEQSLLLRGGRSHRWMPKFIREQASHSNCVALVSGYHCDRRTGNGYAKISFSHCPFPASARKPELTISLFLYTAFLFLYTAFASPICVRLWASGFSGRSK